MGTVDGYTDVFMSVSAVECGISIDEIRRCNGCCLVVWDKYRKVTRCVNNGSQLLCQQRQPIVLSAHDMDTYTHSHT